MSKMILGRKLGMTQIFSAEGKRVGVTVVQVGPMKVLAKKSAHGDDKYAAVKVGFEEAVRQEKDGSVRFRGVNKPEVGVFTSAGIENPMRVVAEFRCTETELDNYTVGQTLDHTLFAEGEYVDAVGISKGKGFMGVMKAWHFKGFKGSHGVHETKRGPGSIGAHTFPARVFKGKKMAGHHSNKRITVQNLRVIRVIAEDNLYLILGSIPGGVNGLIRIQPAVKKAGAIFLKTGALTK